MIYKNQKFVKSLNRELQPNKKSGDIKALEIYLFHGYIKQVGRGTGEISKYNVHLTIKIHRNFETLLV